MRSIWLYLLLYLVLSLQLSGCQQSNDAAYQALLKSLYSHSVPTVAAPDLHQELTQDIAPVLLDTRSLPEFQVSHLPGARYVGYETPDLSVLKDVPLDTPLVLYCAVGYRSEKVGEQLQAAGYTQVRHLHGGLFEWVNQGLPVYTTTGQTDSVHAYNRSWGLWLQKGHKVYD